MTEYRIKNQTEGKGFSYQPLEDTIVFELKDGILSDYELILYTADSLTHEHIHNTLYKLFGMTTCCLFDGIEHHFRAHHELHRRYLRSRHKVDAEFNRMTYKDLIETFGFNYLLIRYDITKDDIAQATHNCSIKGDLTCQ